ncbi:Alpha-2C adrenergic receptor [Holothuria leucospilota]|uniref:Alpha-2C adrenergic receptor n=1 Tax=Holothuria leucospilota TaxID=206669 RepID=A0A9Q1HA83_HOLLE|nr:Alpha-2C adrenergic receptor [Holothuria leucospilota]
MAVTYIVTVISVILMVGVGVPGNIGVILVFKKKSTEAASKILIRNLAYFDLFFCSVSPIGFILWIPKAVTNVTCQVLIFYTLIGDFLSLFLTLLLAVDRYIAVCKDKKYLLKPKQIQRATWFAFVVSIIFAFVNVVSFGAENIDGAVTCTVRKGVVTSLIRMVVIVVVFLLYIASCVTVSLLHLGLLRKMRNHDKIWKNRETSQRRLCSNDLGSSQVESNMTTAGTESHSITVMSSSQPGRSTLAPSVMNPPRRTKKWFSRFESNKISVIENVHFEKDLATASVSATSMDCSATQVIIGKSDETVAGSENGKNDVITSMKRKGATQRQKSRRAPFSRITIMLSIVTVVYVISWIPAFITTSLSTLRNYPEAIQTKLGEFLYHFMRKSPSWPHTLNPIIYCLANPQFRKSLRKRLFGESDGSQSTVPCSK